MSAPWIDEQIKQVIDNKISYISVSIEVFNANINNVVYLFFMVKLLYWTQIPFLKALNW